MNIAPEQAALVAEFVVKAVPQFGEAEQDARLYDCVVGQRALWSHLTRRYLTQPGTMAELRLGRSGPGAPVRLALRFYAWESETSADREQRRAIAEAAAMLPAQFEWQLTPHEELDGTLGVEDSTPMYLARLMRRLEFIDLPAKSRTLIRAGGEGGAEDATTEAGLLGWSRSLPGRHTHLRELELRRLCLPLQNPVDEFTPRQRTLFEEFGRADVAIVSICFTALARSDHKLYQQLALNWKRFLDPFAGELASTGFAPFAALRATYDRFGLPPGYLLNASIRVAANSESGAVGLANILAATLGGSQAFQVVPRDGALSAARAQDHLLSDTDDVPSAWSDDQDREEARRETMSRLSADHGIETVFEEELLDFIFHLPHIYTCDEAERLARLPIASDEGLPGLESHLVAPFTVPNRVFLDVLRSDGRLAPPPSQQLRVGMIMSNRLGAPDGAANRYRGRAWHVIDPRDLTKHALIVGGTGSGKTMTTTFLVQEVARLGVKLMVIEPVKTEYFDLLDGKLEGLLRFRLEGRPGTLPRDFLPFDPIRIPVGITIARHASYLKSCFQAAFPMGDVMALVLENGLLEYYTSPDACGFDKYTRGSPARTLRIDTGNRVFPSFETFNDFFLNDYLKREFQADRSAASASQAQEWREIFARRFRNLADGPVGDCFRAAKDLLLRGRDGDVLADVYEPMRIILNGHAIIELDAVPDADHKALLMAFLLTYLFERRQADDFSRRLAGQGATAGQPLKHLLVLEEAHRLLASGAGAASRGGETTGESARMKAVGLFVDMLAEIRAYGQGLAIVEQIPTKIVPEAVKNTNLKIMLRLTASEDREYLGTAMNFTEAQMRFVNGLKVEHGRQINFVCFEEGVDQPILLSLPLLDDDARAQRPGWLYDDFFIAEDVS